MDQETQQPVPIANFVECSDEPFRTPEYNSFVRNSPICCLFSKYLNYIEMEVISQITNDRW